MSVLTMFFYKLCCCPLLKVFDVMVIVSRRGTVYSLPFLLCFVLFLTCVENASATSSGSSGSGVGCSNVKALLEGRGLSVSLDILQEPTTGGVCGTAPSCCGPSMSNSLITTSKRDLESTVRVQATKVATLLQSRAKKFDENFKNLLATSKLGFHQMFTRTYGMIYERHAHLFADLFKDLERYHERGDLDLARAMDEFFAVLYQKMFAVLNSQYHFDEKYLQCVSEHMRELQPFGDVPKKMAVQVKRAFVATRTFTRALISAGEVARNMANMRVQNTCGPMMVRAQSCAACSGLVEEACPNLCLNAARACLPLHADLSPDWDAFVDAMDKVADRLIGPFNIAMVVEPIDIKISEAIMNFQESSQELSETVFSGCGKPVLGQKPADNRYFQNQRMTRSVHGTGYTNYQDVAKGKADNSDDFVIETSEESILKKNPFLLSRGSSRHPSLNDNDKKTDLKTRINVNLNTDSKNDLNDDVSSYQDSRNKDKRMVYERLAHASRSKREADPEPAAVKDSKEITFESYDFESDNQRGGGGNRKKGRRKQQQQQQQQQGGRKKKVEDEIMSVVSNEEDEDTGDSHLNQSLERLVKEVRQRVRETRRLWSRIPQMHCDGISAPAQEERCWNGTHVAKYLPSLAGEGSAALATNPELRGSTQNGGNGLNLNNNGGTPAAAIITAQQFTLRSIISKLKNAYNGLDVEWGEEEESSSLMYGSGSGSGYVPETDDEDDGEPGGPPDQEGSGHRGVIPESPKFDPKEPDQDLDETIRYNPPVVIQNETEPTEDHDNESDINENTIDNEIDKDRGSSSTSGVVGREEMSLERALITYLFPIVCVWFGGIITDIA